ncbi:MAG: ABC-2 family transporter protein [Lachnospiraceae bacterium]|nr:ABC-2 family transporter protein [Lachnospiraceae bacterium]
MSLRKSISLYIRYAAICVRSIMEYKLSFGLMIFGRCMIAFTEFLAIRFLFDGLTEIKGYTYGDVLLCFSVMHMAFTLAELFGNGFKVFSGIVKSGEFDRMLLRPCSPILQIMGTRFEIGRTGPLITSTITLCIGIAESKVSWNLLTALTLALMIVGATFLFIGLYMLGASFCFFTIEDTSILNALTYGAKEHGKYPIDVYGRGVLRFCTFVIPYTLVQYYPLQFLLGRSTNRVLGLYPVGVVVFLAICYGVWCAGVRNYKSCGS